MNKKFLLLATFIFCCLSVFAQTKNEARKLFLEGDYEKAKPIFLKYLRRTPKDANLNYWYGACCYHTQDTIDAEPYLLFAAEKKIQGAYACLGNYYYDKERFNDAAVNYEKYISLLTDDSLKTVYRLRLNTTKKLSRMIKTTEKVCFVDSFVVDKDVFLNAYKLSSETGTLTPYNSFFQKKDIETEASILFEGELGDRIFYSLPTESAEGEQLKLYSAQKDGEKWSKPVLVKGLESKGNQNYPFMLSDGVTFYFANDGEESLGGYDIFITRYNSEADRFLLPENIGMPFNSLDNDYMYVVDEVNNLGWFATDRRQPEDKVCIYVFIPQPLKATYDYEKDEVAKIHRAAKIQSIAESQQDVDAVRTAKQRLMMAMYSQNMNNTLRYDFVFVIDDLTEYHFLKDFKSIQAKEKFQKWQKTMKSYKTDSLSLEEKRMQYYNGDKSEKTKLMSQILALEKNVERTEQWLKQEEVAIRNEEKKYLIR